MLNKDLVLYERDGDGSLIPQEVKLELSKEDKVNYPELEEQTISIVPMPRGELKKMFGLGGKDSDKKPETDKDTDAEIIIEYCREPKFTTDELTFAKPVIIRSIVRTIFSESGVKIDKDSGKKRIDDDDELGKN